MFRVQKVTYMQQSAMQSNALSTTFGSRRAENAGSQLFHNRGSRMAGSPAGPSAVHGVGYGAGYGAGYGLGRPGFAAC